MDTGIGMWPYSNSLHSSKPNHCSLQSRNYSLKNPKRMCMCKYLGSIDLRSGIASCKQLIIMRNIIFSLNNIGIIYRNKE